jgi:hypothetical protein
LFCATIGASGLHTYSRIRLHPEGACFVRTSPTPLPVTDPADLSWLQSAVTAHAQHARKLNSHDLAYTKCFPGKELEYKYNLPPDAPIWALAADAHHRIANGALPGMVSRYRDDLEVWHYDNDLFEVIGPDGHSG